jgi:hypothetical protein
MTAPLGWVLQPLSLRQRFLDWHHGLPEFALDRRFAMSEFEAAPQNARQAHQSCAFGVRMAAQADMEHNRALALGCLLRTRVSINRISAFRG